jgi:hypothetical protein
MMELGPTGPCPPPDQTLDIVNAIVNTFQIVALSFLTAWASKARNGKHRRSDDNVPNEGPH